jgi:hypothetical protein
VYSGFYGRFCKWGVDSDIGEWRFGCSILVREGIPGTFVVLAVSKIEVTNTRFEVGHV